MKKIGKISLIAFLILLLLALAIFAFVIKTFDPNDLKPRITDFFQQKYQRKLDIPGNLKISLFPVVHIESGPVRLMEKNGAEVFASVESANIFLMLWPLIDGRLEVNKLELEAPLVNVKRFSDGTMNIDDFLSAGGGALPAFDIKSLKINRAAWLFDDQQTQWKVSNANLQVGRLANGVPTDISFDGDVRLNQDDYNLHVGLKSPLLFDLNKQNFSLEKLTLSIKGMSKAVNKMNDITLNATGAMAFDGAKKQAHFSEWQLQSQLANGEEKWNAEVSFAEAEQQGKNWRAKDISSRAEQQTSAYHLNTTLTLPEFSFIDAHMSGKEIKLVTQWTAKPEVKKSGAQKIAQTKPDAIESVLTIGALDDVNDTGEHVEIINLQAANLEAKGLINQAPMRLQAVGNVQIYNNNQIVTKDRLSLQFSYQPADFLLEGSIKTSAKIILEQGLYDLNSLTLDIKIAPKDFNKPLALNGSGAVKADLKHENVKANLQGKLNGAKLDGKFGMAGFASPAYSFDIFLSLFNTVWLEGKAASANKPTDLPDLSWIKKLNANGVMRIGEFISADKRATNVRIDVKSDYVKSGSVK
ncbi:MAG: AsmA family protein [Burkholderiales bacterium]